MRKFTLSMLVLFVSVIFLAQSAFSQNILAVDRDGSADLGFTDCWPLYMAALDANGYTYTYYEVTDLTMDGPDLATMQMYDIVIWFTGEGWQNDQTMTDNDEANLAAYLDGGGFLFFSGQDFLWDRWSSAGTLSSGDFPYDYFGLTEVAQDTWVISGSPGDINGVAGSLAEGFMFQVADIFTTDKDGLYIDEIVGTMGMNLFEVAAPAPVGNAAVQFDGGDFKTVFTTVSFAAITDPAVQADLLMEIVDYLYAPTADCENFDALTVGGLVADQLGDPWTTWSGTPGSSEDAPVSDMYSHSPDNSFTINDGGIDLVFQLDAAAITTGQWLYSHWMYVPTGYSGYFNVQTDPVAGTDWNLDLYFEDGGTGYFGTQATDDFTYPQDTWFLVEINYDLDAGAGQVYFDGVMIVQFENTLSIGGIDYWGWDGGGDPGAYYDDVCFGPGWEIVLPVCENFDALTVGGLVADQLGDPWTTWSGTPGSSEDAPVSDMYSHSPDNSFTINDGGIDLVYQLGTEAITSGQWLYSHWMYVPTGYSGYFNVQTDPVAGTDWNLDLYFEDGGTGYFGTQATDDFTYPQDTWFFIEINYDLDAGAGQVYFDGDMIVQFDNTLSIGGIDYWGWDGGGDPGAYYDDVCFGPGWEIILPDCENFDALTVGGLVADQLGGMWTTWSGTPGSSEDAPVSDMYSHSPDNSFTINDGGIDLVYQLGTEAITSGQWLYSHWIYVPTGYSGYFNVQTDPVAGTDWNLDVFFEDGGTGYFGTQSSDEFYYTQDTWIFVEINYDLDNGYCEVLFDGILMTKFENTLSIGGIDYWGWDGGGAPGAYYDDVCFGPGYEILPPDCENFDALTVGGLVADQLGGMWTTWSGTPGSSEDAPVSDMYSHSPDNSFTINDGGIDLIYQLGTEAITSGQWLYSHYMYVPTGYSGYFNVQTDPVAGTDWNLDLYFEDGGTGYFGTQATDDFTYSQDTWFMVEINYDLDNGYGQVLFDGELIVEFENTLTIGGIDYWGWDGGGDPGAYYDDVCFGTGWIVTSIEDHGMAVSGDVNIFPNPARDRITIESENIIDEVLIYNNMGQLVYSGQVDNEQIVVNTSTFVTGMYIVQVRSGQSVEVRKLIIE